MCHGSHPFFDISIRYAPMSDWHQLTLLLRRLSAEQPEPSIADATEDASTQRGDYNFTPCLNLRTLVHAMFPLFLRF